MATTISHSFDDTFNVYDYVKQVPIGQIALMSDGWAAYMRNQVNYEVIGRRIGTYKTAALAIQAIDKRFNIKKAKG